MAGQSRGVDSVHSFPAEPAAAAHYAGLTLLSHSGAADKFGDSEKFQEVTLSDRTDWERRCGLMLVLSWG